MNKKILMLLTILLSIVSAYAQSNEVDGTSTSTNELITFTTLEGTVGISNENADHLFDGSPLTKWCPNFTKKQEGETVNGAYVIFKTSLPIVPTNYTLTTANDTQQYPGRNWKQWQLYGMNAGSDADVTRESDKWVPLDKKYNIGQDMLPGANYTAVEFSLSEGNTTPYMYFKIEIDDIFGSTYCMQMAEFLLDGIIGTIPFADANVKAICVSNWDTDEDGDLSMEEAAAVTNIGELFKDNNSITSFKELQFFTGLSNIDDDAFNGCSSLTSVTLPKSVTSIGNHAFNGCGSLTVITIPESVTSIGDYAFNGCSDLTSVTLPESLTSIGVHAFEGCSSLTSVIIPESVTSIGVDAFNGCSSLTTVDVKNPTPVAITQNTFSNCTYATLIVPSGSGAAYLAAEHWKEFNETVAMDDAISFADANVKAICVSNWDTNGDGELSYAEAIVVTSLGNAFQGNTSITSFDELQYFKGLTTIEGYAFYNCTNLTSITLPKNVTTIENYAFYDCGNLSSITIPETVTSVRVYAFSDRTPSFKWDSSSKSLTITANKCATIYYSLDGSEPTVNSMLYTEPIAINRNLIVKAVAVISGHLNSDIASYTITNVDSKFFVRDYGLYFRLIDNTTENVVEVTTSDNYAGDIIIPSSVDYNGTTYTVTRIGNSAFSGKPITSVVLPNTIEAIGQSAFYNCNQLASINIPNKVKIIESQAFQYCNQLTQIDIPSSVTQIQQSAFSSCSALKDVVFHEGLQSIGSNAFRSCSEIKSLLLPESLTEIGTETFRGCSSLSSVTLPSTITNIPGSLFAETGLVSMELPSSVKTICYSAFYSCSQLTSIKIPEGVEMIENYAFCHCNALTSLALPSTLTAMEYNAFYNCSSLQTVALPENLSTMGNSVFENCSSLTSVYCLAATPPAMPDGNAFKGVTSKANLFVNVDAVDTYKSTNYWAEFMDITSFDQIPCAQPIFIFSDYVLTMSSLTQGATIYYTTDGSDPTTSSTLYTEPIPFDKNGIVKAVAIKEGMNDSPISVFEKTFAVDRPVFSLSDDLKITITTITPNSKIYYYCTNELITGRGWDISSPSNGRVPYSPESFLNNYPYKEYSEPFSLTSSCNVYACVIRDGWTLQDNISVYSTWDFSLNGPNISWDLETKTVNITHNEDGVTIYYTLDGSEPTTASTLYNEPFIVDRNHTVRAIAIKPGRFTSSISSYTITSIDTKFYVSDYGLYFQLVDNSTENVVEVTSSDNYSGNITIPSSVEQDGITYAVTRIGNNAFKSCDGLSSVTIPNSVISIAAYAFWGCTRLSSVTIPESVISIGNNAFQSCYNLSSVTIPNSVTTIGDYAFQYCNSLKTVTSGISNPFDVNAFSNFDATLVVPKGLRADYKSVSGWDFAFTFEEDAIIERDQTDEQGVKYTLKHADDDSFFYAVTGHSDEMGTEIIIPADLDGCPVKSIEGWAFNGCSALTSVTLGDQLTTLGEYAFYNCNALTSVTLGNQLTSIGNYAFNGCNSLKTVTSGISTPFDVNAFSSFDATLVVPKGSLEDYKSVGGWDFAFTFEEDAIIEREQTDEQGLFYTLKQADDDSFYYAVTGHSDEIDTEIIIPADLDGCPVKSIENAFNSCTDLSSVIIPKSVTTIGNDAFRGCSSLTSVSIPNSVTSIESNAFNGCNALTSVKLGKSVTKIGDYAFNNCSSLTSITLPNVLESIGNSAFSGCALTSINIPGSVKSIGSSAFSSCSSLASVSFEDDEDGITSIGDRAFANCALTSITIPNSVTRIGGYAFSGNNSLATVILGDGIEEIKGCMFEYCSALTSITIPDGVTSIGGHAFYGCYSLTSIKLPETLTSLEIGAFNNCGLKSIELPNSFTNIPDNLFVNNNFQYIKLGNKVKSIGKNAFGSIEPVIVIGTSSPPTIDENAFPNVEYLADINVIVPDAKAETAYKKKAVWEDMTFSNQSNISEVTVETPGDLSFELITQCNMMPAKVVGLKVNGTINDDDFTQMLTNMKSLLRLDLSDCEITEIPDNALNGKTQLQELTLPAMLQTLGNNAFRGCTYLTGELELPSTLTSIGEYAFVGTAYTSVKLPSTLKTIGNYAFNNVPIKQKLTLPGKVNSVGAYAFAGTQVNGLVIPDGVTSIGDYAFDEAPIQGHVTIPDGVTTLGRGAFRNTQISTVFLPNSITTLSYGLFQGCQNLNTVYVPDNFTGMDNYAFDGCGALTILRLSANTTSMGEYTFQSTPLEYIKVPSPVETLPRGVFKNCKQLESLSLPGNLKSIESEALYGCTALRNMSVEATTPPTIKDRSVMRGINTDKCLISIPTSAYRAYVLAEYWGQFVQMRNDIAVETEGNGEIAFESVEEEEEEEALEAKRRGQRLTRRAPELATDEESMTFANNGSSIYIPQQGKVRFYIIPAEGEELLSATLDGEDIMPFIVDGVYVATADKKNAKLVVKFSGSGQGDVLLAGDANNDGTIDVSDIVAMINAILGKPSTEYHAEAADINEDKEVDVFDVQKAINLLFSQNNAPSRSARTAISTMEQAYVTTSANDLTLGIHDADRFTAFQFDVDVADGMELTEARLTSTETNHILRISKNGDHTYKVIGLSMNNSTFSVNGNDLLELSFSKGGYVHINNIMFVTPQETKVYFAGSEVVVTDIVNMMAEQQTDEVFDLSGRKVNTDRNNLPKGVYIINNKKVIIK